MSQLASYYMGEINQKSERFKRRYYDFLFRINRKLNEQEPLRPEEEQKLTEIYKRATEPRRLKW